MIDIKEALTVNSTISTLNALLNIQHSILKLALTNTAASQMLLMDAAEPNSTGIFTELLNSKQLFLLQWS